VREVKIMRIPYWYEEEQEDDFYFDYKEFNVRFPKHLEDMNGECVTWNLYEIIK
jgi:hypothetical protein